MKITNEADEAFFIVRYILIANNAFKNILIRDKDSTAPKKTGMAYFADRGGVRKEFFSFGGDSFDY